MSMRCARWTALRLFLVVGASLGFAPGCVQLVAFEQPIIGQPDYTGPSDQRRETLCDDNVEMGGSALCQETCDIESGETSCADGRASIDGQRATVNVEGFDEVELTLTVCHDGDARAFRLREGDGAAVSIVGRALSIVHGDDVLMHHAEHLPEEGCTERTLIFQPARMALLDAGRRACADSLPALQDAWTMELSDAVRSAELCLRR